MTLFKCTFVALLFIVLPSGKTIAQQKSANTLESLRATYETAKFTISDTCMQRKKEALKKYGIALDTMMPVLKEKGDLTTYLVVEKEKKRFSSEGKAPDGTNVAPSIAGAVDAYHKDVADAETEQNRRSVILIKKYIPALDRLIKQFMKTDRIEDAKAVKTERDRVEFELAELQSKLPEPIQPGNPSQSTDSQRRLVIWNTHNGRANNSGVLLCDVTLTKGSTTVWKKEGLEMPWSPNVDESTSIDLPRGLIFEKVRIDVLKISKDFGGLAEIQVFDGGKNIAEGCSAKASACLTRSGHDYLPELVTDGITSSATQGVGSWFLPRGQPGWIEVDLRNGRNAGNADTVTFRKKLRLKESMVFSRHHYLMVAEQKSWDEAQKACKEIGGHLVTIASKEENDFVNKLANGQSVWIGCTDEENEGEWKWVTGEKFAFTDWGPQQPGGMVVENYGGFYKNRWHDFPTAHSWITAYICEWDY